MLIATMLFFTCNPASLQADDNEWITEHFVTKTTETKDHNDEGEIIGIRTVTETRVSVVRNVTETQQRDSEGFLRLVGRTTVISETSGGRITIVEALVGEDKELAVTAITTYVKTPSKDVTTYDTRNSDGELILSKRVTNSRDPSGSVTTTVETPDKDGQLVVRQTTTYQETSQN